MYAWDGITKEKENWCWCVIFALIPPRSSVVFEGPCLHVFVEQEQERETKEAAAGATTGKTS